MKIAITDEVHLKAVCEVLESIGYKLYFESEIRNYVLSYIDGSYAVYESEDTIGILEYEKKTLTDLLRMRDEMVKESLS